MRHTKILSSKIQLSFLLVFLCGFVKAQYNEMVFNGGFEYGNPANIPSGGLEVPSDYYTVIQDWATAEGSFDYYDYQYYLTHQSDYPDPSDIILPPITSGRFIGMVGYTSATPTGRIDDCLECPYSPGCNEAAIDYIHPLRSIGQGAIYKLSFNAAFSKMGGDFPTNPVVKIHFVSADVTYSSDGQCIDHFDWMSSNPALEYDFALDDANPYQWQSFSKYFQVPEGYDNKFSWIVVEGYCGNQWGYIFVDNVSVEEFNYCECSSESGSPVVEGSIPNAMAEGDPWYVTIDNTTSAQFEVFDRWDNVVYNVSLFDAGVLCNCPTYSNFDLFWDGVDNPNVTASNYNSGSWLPVGVYSYILTLGNCHGHNTYTGSITIVGNLGGSPQYMYPIQSYNVATCCPTNDDFEFDDFGGLFHADVGDNITIGATGAVSMDAGCNAGFYAGNSITIGPNTHIQPGAGFVHLVTQSCTNQFATDYNNGGNRPDRRNTSNFNRNAKTINTTDTSNIGVYPNPSTGIYNVVFTQTVGNEKNMQLIVMDMFGNIISNTTVNSLNISLNLSGKPSGVYTLKIITGTSVYYKKLIKE